ncbi:MAG TPA: V-type ATP synthase subunit E [Oscillospiraceae bacterium]|nr:V-type ATP synthase subunit E [Oscillospiraceae bacterium]
MSGAEKLKEKIVADATSEAEDLLAGARERAAASRDKAEAEAAAKKQKIEADVAKKAAELQRRDQTIAELDARKAILAAKEDLIEDTFKQALTRLQNLEPQAYQAILFNMLLATASTGSEEIIISPADKVHFSPEFLARVNKALTQEGKQGNLQLSAETRELQGGFVLSAGDVEINSSFAALLRMQRDQLEPEVAAILFTNA